MWQHYISFNQEAFSSEEYDIDIFYQIYYSSIISVLEA